MNKMSRIFIFEKSSIYIKIYTKQLLANKALIYLQSKIEELKKEKEEAEAVRSEKEEVKKVAEEPEKIALEKYQAIEEERKAKADADKKAKDEAEAREAFAHIDNNGDGTLTVEELQSRQTFDTNRDGQVSEEEARVSIQFSSILQIYSVPVLTKFYFHKQIQLLVSLGVTR